MKAHAFSEDLGRKTGFIRGMDARGKLLLAAACAFLALAAGKPSAPLFVCGLFLLLSFSAGVSVRSAVLRMAGPVMFGLAAAALQALLSGGTPALVFDLLGRHLFISYEGLARGVGIIARVLGAASVVLFLTMTTPAHRLLSAAAWYRLPKGFVELCFFTYRYIFVLIEDAFKVYHAQRGRLGYARFRTGIKSIGTLCGSVLFRAYSQAEATGASMALRGYTGEFVPVCREKMGSREALFLCANFSLCLAFFIWTR